MQQLFQTQLRQLHNQNNRQLTILDQTLNNHHQIPLRAKFLRICESFNKSIILFQLFM